MNGILIRWLISGCGLLLVGYLVPGIEVEGLFFALLAAALLGILNAVVRPVLLLLTLPLTVLTLGLFILVINGLMFMMLAWLLPGIHIQGFWSAFAGALLFGIIGWVTNSFINEHGRIQIIDLHKGSDGHWS